LIIYSSEIENVFVLLSMIWISTDQNARTYMAKKT
jgi:hypothetical protein